MGGQGRCEKRSEVFVKIQKKNWGGRGVRSGGGGEGSGWGGGHRVDVSWGGGGGGSGWMLMKNFVKIQKKKVIFFWGGGWVRGGGGFGLGGQAGCE